MNKSSIILSLCILSALAYGSLAIAGYAVKVTNLTPFTLKIKAKSIGAIKPPEVTVNPKATGESKTGAADLLSGVEVKATIPGKGDTLVYEDKWLGQAKQKDITIYVVADVKAETTTVPARGGTVGGTMTTYKLNSLSIHGKRGTPDKVDDKAVITIK